jgi:hypothetical protein
MTTWKITTEHKKSIVQTEYWKNLETGQKITYNLGWRWGEYYVTAPENTTIEEWLESYDEDEGVSVFDEFEVEDSSEDDGWWVDYEFEGMTEEEIEAMEEFLEGGSLLDLESDNWVCTDSETILTGPLNIEEVSDENGSN